jgi:FdhD protein
MPLPHLTLAQVPLTCEIDAVNEYGEALRVSIPAERALTLYVDKRELVTLMTLGAHPELLVLGYLRNQRLVESVHDIESITVDWEVGAAAVKTCHGIEDIDEKTSRRVVTTGCGQGSMFGGLMDEVDQIVLPANAAITQSQLYALVNTIRLKETTYKSAGSVHACALFDTTSAEPEMLLFVEDVGRHNAIDTIAGWMWMNMAPTLVASRTALPPEGALRLRPGKAGSAALAGGDGAPTLPHCVRFAAPRGGHPACGLAKPDPRPELG